jgi:hypothetical protein
MEIMIINLEPQRRNDELVVFKKGDILIINGKIFDFTPLPDNSILPSSAVNCEFIAGNILKKNGEIMLSLILPLQTTSTIERKFPKPIINPIDGYLEFPK